MARVVAFCREALEARCIPVLLAYSLGKAQEILCALTRSGLVAMLHPSVLRMTGIYHALWPDFPGIYKPFDAARVMGHPVIWPPNAVRSPALQVVAAPRRTAVLTGWAVESSARFRYRADAAFPLSDHADYDDLLEYVARVRPRRVFTLHGFAAAFAADLRRRGIEAWALSEENQLELLLGDAGSAPSLPSGAP